MKESNRPKHIGAGAVILFAWFVFCIFLLKMSVRDSSVTGLLSVIICMCSCEFKDREYGAGGTGLTSPQAASSLLLWF